MYSISKSDLECLLINVHLSWILFKILFCYLNEINFIVERKLVDKPFVKMALKKAVLNVTVYFCLARRD